MYYYGCMIMFDLRMYGFRKLTCKNYTNLRRFYFLSFKICDKDATFLQ